MSDFGVRLLLQAIAYERAIRALLYRITPNVDDVDELLQETYARLLAAEQGSTVRSVRSFALTAARNVALDALRHRQVVPIDLVGDLETLDVPDESPPIEDEVNADQELELLAAALEKLPPRCGQIFTLHKVHGFSRKEIALRLEISENTVREHMARAARLFAYHLFNSHAVRQSSLVSRLGAANLRKKGEGSK